MTSTATMSGVARISRYKWISTLMLTWRNWGSCKMSHESNATFSQRVCAAVCAENLVRIDHDERIAYIAIASGIKLALRGMRSVAILPNHSQNLLHASKTSDRI